MIGTVGKAISGTMRTARSRAAGSLSRGFMPNNLRQTPDFLRRTATDIRRGPIQGPNLSDIGPRYGPAAPAAMNPIRPSGASRRGPIAKMPYKGRSALVVGGTMAAGGAGFLSGIDSNNQVSNSVYGLAFGDQDFDKYVMGRKMGLRSLMAPLPGERFGQSGVVGAVRYPTAFANARRQSRMSTPQVDGSIAFGMYNSRLG